MKKIGDMATLNIGSHCLAQGKVVAIHSDGRVEIDQTDWRGDNHIGVPN
ncbi:MAG: hypothetical protein ACI9H6_000205 [Patiriisocius sp.]|jgi:hypothetical protein